MSEDQLRKQIRGALRSTIAAHGPVASEHVGSAVKRILGVTRPEIERLERWINDLQSGMYVNCVYCGHRYGPKEDTPVSMADVLKAHVEQCPQHPMAALKRERDELNSVLASVADQGCEKYESPYNCGWYGDDEPCIPCVAGATLDKISKGI